MQQRSGMPPCCSGPLTVHLEQRCPGRVSLCVLERGISAGWRALGRREKRRDGAISPGEAQQPGSGEAAATKGFVYHEGGESHTKPWQGTALPALQPSPRTGCCAGGNLSCSPGCSLGGQSSGQPVTLACFPFAQFPLFPVSPSCDLWQSHPKFSPKLCQGTERLKAPRAGAVQGQETCHSWISTLFRRTHQPRECPSSIAPKAQEN